MFLKLYRGKVCDIKRHPPGMIPFNYYITCFEVSMDNPVIMKQGDKLGKFNY